MKTIKIKLRTGNIWKRKVTLKDYNKYRKVKKDADIAHKRSMRKTKNINIWVKNKKLTAKAFKNFGITQNKIMKKYKNEKHKNK